VRRTVYKGSGDGPPAMRNWDLSAGTVHVRGTVIRMRGQGLTITSAPKTKAGFRTLLLPSWAVEILRMRPYGGPDRTVFCSMLGGLLDRDNTIGYLREALNAAGFEWVTSHTFRKTVAHAHGSGRALIKSSG